MVPSPPEEAEHIRGKTLTPESPKPLHYPSPANVPLLEQSMDPMFQINEPALSIGTPTPYQPSYHQTHTSSAQSTTSLYGLPQQQAAPMYQNAVAQGAIGGPSGGYTLSTAYGGGYGQTQDTSIHNSSSISEATDTRATYPSSYDQPAYAHQTQAPQNPQPQANPAGGVNYQALLDSLSPTADSDRHAAPSMLSQSQAPVSSRPAPANLPPRPPPQDKSAPHPNEDIRSFHPHSQKSSNSQFRGSGQLQPLNVRGGGNASMEVQSATRSNKSPSTPGYGQRQSEDRRSVTPDDEDARWPAHINRLYDEFLEDERKYVTDGQWDQFPYGSRLFIGNLPSEKVTKRDIFHRFFRHGKLAQISIKQAYGFVQFLDTASCHEALQAEQGHEVRGRRMHLEISKPQKNTKKADGSANDRNNDRNTAPRRRSRSPDYTRGGTAPPPRNIDRYNGRDNAMSPRDRDNRRFRDDYRNRSPSPPRGGRGNRGRDRSPDWYDGRRRSRSRSPRRYRSPSPRRDMDDDCPLPFRRPDEVPDIQVLVSEGLPADYIAWVEDNLQKTGLRATVLVLSSRLSEAAVVRRQIVEGVLAIAKLNNSTVQKGTVNLQVFDRRGGLENVQFNEYADLDPGTAAALVQLVKKSQSQPQQPTAPQPQPYTQNYGLPPVAAPSYANPQPPASQYPPMAAVPPNPPNLSSLISSLDSNGLSQLLGAMSQNKSLQQQQQPSATAPADLARLLQSITTPQPQQQQQQQQHHQNSSYPPSQGAPQPGYPPPNSYPNAALASLFAGQNPQAQSPSANAMNGQGLGRGPPNGQGQGQPDMNEIMAQLAKYKR